MAQPLNVHFDTVHHKRLKSPISYNLSDPKLYIHPKYSKHCPYTVAHTIDYVSSKILGHVLNQSWVISFTFQAYTLYFELYL